VADRYRVGERIGQGGMATVYRATDLKHGRLVAIKMLRPELLSAGPEAERFLREIRIAARLSHPNILPLLDSGTTGGADEIPYFIMPFVDGESLRARLDREGRLPLAQALRIGAGIAEALDYAHRQDVIHRDVKPENILLYEDQAVVADFGIARAVSAAASDQVTARGLVLGTPAYMSPEQVAGDPGLDGRSDLYALACVVYEMLAGAPPFAADSARGTLIRHLLDPMPSLAARGIVVGSEFERHLARGLAKEPADRWSTGRALLDALAMADRSAPAAAPAPAPPRSVAVLPFVDRSTERGNEYLSDGITDGVIEALARVSGLEVAPHAAVFEHKGSRLDPAVVGGLLEVEAVLSGSVERAGDQIWIEARLTRVADERVIWTDHHAHPVDDVARIASDLAARIVTELRLGFLAGRRAAVGPRYTESPVAHQLYLTGRFAWNLRTPEGIAQAIDYFEQAIAADPGYAPAYSGLSDAHSMHIDYRAAPVGHGMEQARINAERALALDDELAEAHTSLGWVSFIHDWDWERARREFERAITLNPRYATARQWYAWSLVSRRRLDEAIAEARIARELEPNSVSIRRSLGWVYYYARRNDASVAELEQAVLMNPTSDETQYILGLALTEAGRYDEAERILAEAHAGSRAYFHPLASLGRIAAVRGRRAEAEAVLQTLHGAAGTRYVSPVDFVRIYLALGDRDQAFAWIERAHAERRGWLAYLAVDPILDPVRDDPRLDRWLARMNLAGKSA
jgi:serine/threonine-protein kinase